MKKILKNCAVIFALATLAVSTSSCDPYEVDAFVDGFYTGYYGETPPGGYYVAPQVDVDSNATECVTL